jgi:hypothetical protein
MCEVFLNNDVDLHTLCVAKYFNCYLRPFSTMIRLTRLSKSKKKFFPQKWQKPGGFTQELNPYQEKEKKTRYMLGTKNVSKSVVYEVMCLFFDR